VKAGIIFLNVLKNIIQQVFFNVKSLFQHNEIVPNSWVYKHNSKIWTKNSMNIINGDFSK
jgi:hypothetical protein